MKSSNDIDDVKILNDAIEDLHVRARHATDPDEASKFYDRLLKAISLRRRDKGTKRGKGFDLGE